MNKAVIAIDIGGTNIKTALTSINQITSIIHSESESTAGTGKLIMEQLINTIKRYIDNFKSEYTICGIGIATAGMVDHEKGKIIDGNNNIPGWIGTDLKKPLEEEFSLPVLVENDVNAAVRGEYQIRTEPISRFFGITLGTGIGGGIIINGELLRGNYGLAGEVGYMVIKEGGRKSQVMNNGAWEMYVSRRGIMKTAAAFLPPDELDKITVKDIFDRARDGKKQSREIVNKTGYYIAVGLKNIMYIFEPQLIVIGGGIAEAGDILLHAIKQYFYTGKIKSEQVSLELATLGNRAGLIGITGLFLKEYRNK